MSDTDRLLLNFVAVSPVTILWISGASIMLGDALLWRRRAKWLNPTLAIGGMLIALARVTRSNAADLTGEAFGRMLLLDPLYGAGAVGLLLAGVLAMLLAASHLRTLGIEKGEYYALSVFALSGALLMIAANDLIMLFLGLEVMSFGLYVLAGFARTEARSEEASVKYFLLGVLASAFLLYGIALCYGAAGSTDYVSVQAAVVHGNGGPMLMAGIGLLLVGMGFKAALVPFHQWAPDVYEGAPTSATAFMAVTAKFAAFLAVIRLLDMFGGASWAWMPALRTVAVLSMVLGNVWALAQTNLKRMLAYSSIAHAGYLVTAAVAIGHKYGGAGSALSHTAATGAIVYYLFAYAFMTVGAFGVLTLLATRKHDPQRLDDLRGLARRSPFVAYAMLVFMLSLAGVPPTMGFVAKLQVFMAALYAGEIGLAVVMALASAIGAFFYLRVVWVMCFEGSEFGGASAPERTSPGSIAVAIAALATIAFGVLPGVLSVLTSVI